MAAPRSALKQKTSQESEKYRDFDWVLELDEEPQEVRDIDDLACLVGDYRIRFRSAR
jgi:hypothetical protein